MSGRPARRAAALLAALLAALAAGAAPALESDRDRDVEWSSDGDLAMRVEGDARILEMTVNVKVTQGSLEIAGDAALFEYAASDNTLRRVTVHGSPVRYRQQLDEDGAMVTGTGRTVVLAADGDAGETVIELIGDASIVSPDVVWRCSAITYVVERNLIPSSSGPCEGTLSGAGR